MSATGATESPAARILVVEDDTEMSAEIVACLTSSGYQVEACFDGTEGLNRVLSGRFDLITLDRVLPGHSGLRIARALRDAGTTTPILMLSALSELDERLDGLRAGGDDAAIVRLHDFGLGLEDANPGVRAIIDCRTSNVRSQD